MSYIDTIKKLPQVMTPGSSACQGCGGELITRRVMQLAGNNSVFAVPPGCMAGAGVDGWSYQNGCTAPIHITLLDNTASFMSGVSEIYQRRGRTDVNIVAIAGDGATADCGFQSLSGAAERGAKMLYVCYDNEGYMNTGFQRSSTTSLGSRTSTTPAGSAINGKEQGAKYLPLIMAMHNIEYCATASPSHMMDLTAKIKRGLECSKRGFAYLHVFSPCPTGWEDKARPRVLEARLRLPARLLALPDRLGLQARREHSRRAPRRREQRLPALGMRAREILPQLHEPEPHPHRRLRPRHRQIQPPRRGRAPSPPIRRRHPLVPNKQPGRESRLTERDFALAIR